jgi:branched-chain amino acid transport system substrate-binding protein
MGRRTRFAAVAFASLGLIAAACGGDDSGSSDTTAAAATTAAPATTAAEATTAAPATTAGGETTDAPATTAAGGDFTLDAPIEIAGLVSDPGGNDTNAVPDFNNGVRLAIKQINAAGGIGGQDLNYDAFETLATGDTVINSFNLALEKKPVAIFGPISSTGLLAISKNVDEAGIPLIHGTTEPKATHDGEAGSKWIFGNRTSNDDAATAAVQYAMEELGAKNIGLLYVNTSFGTTGAAVMKAYVEAHGGTITTEQSIEYNATDITNNVLELADSDAIIDWGTPATVGLAVNTLSQQGLGDIPHIGPGSIGFAFFTNIVGDASLLEGLHGALDCNPIGSDSTVAKDFVAAYNEEYGSDPSYAAAESYDTILLFANAITVAQSVEPDAIRQALEDTQGLEGACTTYDQRNGEFNHGGLIATYKDGKLVTDKTYEFTD